MSIADCGFRVAEWIKNKDPNRTSFVRMFNLGRLHVEDNYDHQG